MTNTLSGAVIPQRANVLLTSAFALPGFDMKLRAFRVYKPVADTTKAIGYKFASDGTALWTAKTPMADYCNDATASCRSIYTKLPSGGMIAVTAANASTPRRDCNTYDGTASSTSCGRSRSARSRLDAGVHGSAVAGSAARLRLPGSQPITKTAGR